MNSVNATAVFTNAVETINRGHDGNYQQANKWLSDFKYNPNAWGTLVELINQSSNSDVLFHASNIANSKAKNEWSNINDDVKRSLVTAVREKLAKPAAVSMPHFVVERLCLAQATMICLSGAQDTQQLLQHCIGPLQHDGPAHSMALRMVRTVAERIPELDPGTRTRLAPVMVQFSMPLMQCLGNSLQQSAPEQQAAVIDTLTALLQAIPWSYQGQPALPVSEIGSACLTATPLIISALSTTASRPSASEALLLLVERHETLFPGRELPFMTALIDHLGTLVATVSTGGNHSDRGRAAPLLTSIATVASEAVYACEDLVQCMELARLVSVLVEHVPHRGLTHASAVAEVLFAVNCTPTNSRCRELGPEIYVAAVERILPEATYLEGFTRWEEMDAPDGDDEVGDVEFRSFREDQVRTLLQATYDQAGFGYLARMVSACMHSRSWQALEIAAFALDSTAAQLLKTLDAARRGGAAADCAEALQQAAQINDVLAQFFAAVAGPPPQAALSNQYLLDITCSTLGSFSGWLSTRRDAALAHAVAMVLGAAVSGQPPRVRVDACMALKRLCSEEVPADVLPLHDVVDGICTCLQGLCAITPPEEAHALEESSYVIKGSIAVAVAGARLTCRLLDFRLSPQSQVKHACALVAAPLAVLSAAAQGSTAQHAGQHKVCLAILSTCIKFLEDPASSNEHRQSCVQAAIEQTWPVLQMLSNSTLAQTATVSTGVSDVACAAFSAAGDQRGALISPVCEILQQLFSMHVSAAPLDTIAKMVELSGEGSGVSQEQLGLLYGALVAFVQAAHTATSPPNACQPDVVAAMLSLLKAWGLFHPVALLDCGVLDSALAVATSAACMRERPVVQNALGFLTLLITPNRMLRSLAAQHVQHAAALAAAVTARAEAIMGALLGAVCDTCPPDSWRSAGRVMFHLLSAAETRTHAVAAAARQLQAGEAGGGGAGEVAEGLRRGSRLTQHDCQRFAALCMNAVTLQERRFTAAVMDFAGIARGQEDPDSLLAYEML